MQRSAVPILHTGSPVPAASAATPRSAAHTRASARGGLVLGLGRDLEKLGILGIERIRPLDTGLGLGNQAALDAPARARGGPR